MRLIIDNIEIELNAKTQIALTRQSANLDQLGTRQTSFSNRFTIPLTQRNLETFQYLGTNGNQSQSPYQKILARLETDSGIVIAKDLMLRISSRNTNGIEISLLGTEYDFNQVMKELKFRELMDLIQGGGIHSYDEDFFKDSQNDNSGVVYPLITQLFPYYFNNGATGTNGLFLDLCYPAVFTKNLFITLLEKYFPYYTSNALMHPRFLQDVVFAAYTQSDYWKEFERSTMSLDDGYFSIWGSPSNPDHTWYFYDEWNIYKNDKGWLTHQYFLATPHTVYRANANRKVNIKVKYTITVTDFEAGSDSYLALQIRMKPDSNSPDPADTILAEHPFCYGQGMTNAADQYSGEGQLEVNLRRGQQLYLSVGVTGSFVAPARGTIDILDVEITPSAQQLYGDDNVHTKYLLPDWTEHEFFSDILRRFGLVYEIQNDGSIRLESFKDIFAGAFGFDDWTQKTVGKDSDAFTSTTMGKRSYFQYSGDRSPALDDGTPNMTLDWSGWWMEEMGNFFYDDEKTVVESKAIGRPCYNVPIQNTGFAMDIVGSENSEEGGLFLTLGSLENMVYASVFQDDDFDSYTLKRRQNILDNLGTLLPANKRNVAKWSDWKTLTEFYGDVLTSLDKPIVKTINVFLSEEEYYNLDIFKPKYFEQYQAYFYLLKIENYIAGNAAKATFLQIKRK